MPKWIYIEVAELLIGAGTNLNLKNGFGNTDLICASMEGHTKIVKLLIDARANLDLKNNRGNTALGLAKTGEIRQILLEAMDPEELSSSPINYTYEVYCSIALLSSLF